METNIVLGYMGAVATGLVLGLLGGGGALLSIPVLVYLFHIEASIATGYSLFVIGIAASSGALQNIRRRYVDYNAALYYGIPSVITVYIVRRFVIHELPTVFFHIGSFAVTKDRFILFLLSTVMFGMAYKMLIADKFETETEKEHSINHPLLILYAVIVGCFLGLVGAGGGFLMTPALVYFANLNMKKAIGTSLLLVAVNSFIGFLGDVHSSVSMNWRFLLVFSAFCVSGVLLGSYWGHFIDNQKLKKGFGWFIIITGIYIWVRETVMR